MRDYRVIWEIDVTADSPRAAAEAAQRIQRTPNAWATVFEVWDDTGDCTKIDLLEEDDA